MLNELHELQKELKRPLKVFLLNRFCSIVLVGFLNFFLVSIICKNSTEKLIVLKEKTKSFSTNTINNWFE